MTFAIVSPIYDVVGEYGFHYFDKFGGDVIKIVKAGAVRENMHLLEGVDTIFFTAHGEREKYVGSDLKPLIDMSNCHYLNNKVCFFPVCDVGKDLGEYISQMGTFIGYNGRFDWFTSATTPEGDYYASLFWNIQLKIARDILLGKELKEIFENAMKYYKEAQEVVVNKMVIETLENDRNRFVVFGLTPPKKQRFFVL